ncbi:hypothetical protein KKG48_02290 [Patescibacteria group bacterium]|nr:hypothetical protein [Patescibacteria group bacterium]MCG2694853.1 hypothetical protein [Candidatus Parcubacteria bacterium]
MKIDFTKKQYDKLLKAVYLGCWMANAHRTNDRDDEFDDLESYVFSFAKKFGLEKYLDDENADEKKFFPTRYFEEETEVQKIKEEYDEDTFWDELIERLADSDFYKVYSKAEIKKMSREEYFEKFYEIHDKIAEKINADGLDALKLK